MSSERCFCTGNFSAIVVLAYGEGFVVDGLKDGAGGEVTPRC